MRALRLLSIITVSLVCTTCGSTSPVHPTPPPEAGLQMKLDGPRSIAPGAEAQFHLLRQTVTGTFDDVTSQATWRSSDPRVVAIASSGLAQAFSRGTAQITATLNFVNATSTVLVLEDGTFELSGFVSDGGLPIEGATVRVTQGIGAGLTTTTTSVGRYDLYGVAGPIVLQITDAGYLTASLPLTVTASTIAPAVHLVGSSATADISGAWHLTVSSAASSCATLNDDERSATFDVVVAQSASEATLTISGPKLAQPATVIGRVLGDRLDVLLRSVSPYYYYVLSYPDILEVLSPTRWLAISGTMDLTLSDGKLTGTLNGLFEILTGTSFPSNASVLLSCAAPDNPAAMTR